MSGPTFEDWKKAGEISAKALWYGKKLIKPGASLLEVSEKVEEKVFSLGGKMAFPAQMSCDNIAAHYCAEPDDEIILDEQVVSLDVGARVNGAIGDNAVTVDLSGKWTDLVKASREAVENVRKMIQIGVQIREIGKTIQETIESYGYSPVKNLSGHGIGPFTVHKAPNIPNYDNGNTMELVKGMTIAVEPFATNGVGSIHEIESGNIFSVVHKKNVRNMYARQVLKELQAFDGLPFTTRWLVKKMPLLKVNMGLRELLREGVIKCYPPLLEDGKGMVSQAEYAFYIDDEVTVLTPMMDE